VLDVTSIVIADRDLAAKFEFGQMTGVEKERKAAHLETLE